MRRRLIAFIRSPRLKRVLLVGVILACVGALLFLSLLALLPTIVSSSTVQTRLKTSLTASLKRPVTWSSLVMTWSDGVILKGFCLGDGPAPLRSACIDEIVMVPDFGRGAGGFGIDLALQVRNLRAELAPAPPSQTQVPSPTPPLPEPPAKDPLTALAEAVQQLETLDWPLPLDLRVKVVVAPIGVVYRDLAAKREVTLADGVFRLDMPSLATLPLETTFSGRVLLDGRELGPMRLRAAISQLVTPEQRLYPAAARFDVEAIAPGVNLTAQGGLLQSDGLALRTQLDLPALAALAQPLLPPDLPTPAGRLDFKLDARFDAARNLQVAMTLDGSRIAASGGSLQNRRLGPLDLHLRQKLVTDHQRQVVDFPEGSLILPGLLDVAWSATIEQPTAPERSVTLRCGPLHLDLGAALALAKPLLPPDHPIRVLEGEAVVRNLWVELHGSESRGVVTLDGTGVVLPRLRLALANGMLEGEGLRLTLDRAELPLVALLPTAATADLSWTARQFKLSGAQPVVAERLTGKLRLAVTELVLKSPSPYKVAAKVDLTQSLDLERAMLGAKLKVEKLHQQLRLLARADADGALSASIPELKLTLAKGELLQLQAKAGLSSVTPHVATTEGTARLDLGRVMPLAASFLPAGFTGDGMVTTTWEVAAPLPQGALPVEENLLRRARAAVRQLDRAELTLSLDRLNLRVPSATGPIAITGLQTAPLLRLAVTDRGQAIRLAGGLQLDGVSGLPGTAGQLAPQHGSLTFDGELLDWNLLRLNQELHIKPLGLSQKAEVTIDRIAPLLAEPGPLTPALLLKRLDVSLFADVDARLPRALTPLLPGIELCGRANAGTRIELSAGRELRVRAYAETRDFGVKLGDRFQVEGIRSELMLERRLALVDTRNGAWVPLSAGLVRPAGLATTSVGGSEIADRVRDDLRGAVSGLRTFSVQRAALQAARLPLTLTALEGDLNFAPEELGLTFFQTELLGGTLNSRGVVDLRAEIPLLVATCNFSHLDSAQLMPPELRNTTRKGQSENELTGEFSLTVPLATESRPLLEGLRLKLNLRKIGIRTLERVLFSLDPYEQNEQLVGQRKLLRLGGLKGLRVKIHDGALAVDGEVQVGGVEINLPKVERLRLSELPIRKALAKVLVVVTRVRQGLELARADLLLIDPNGTLSLKRSSDVE